MSVYLVKGCLTIIILLDSSSLSTSLSVSEDILGESSLAC